MKMRGTAIVSGLQVVALGAFLSVAANAAESTVKVKKASAKKVVVKKAKRAKAKSSAAVAKSSAAKAQLVSATLPATSAAPQLAPSVTSAAPPSQTTADAASIATPGSKYYGRFDTAGYGPAVNKWGKTIPNDQGADDGFVNFDNSLSAGYHLTDTVNLQASLNFFWNTTAADRSGFNPDLTLEDPSLKVVNTKLINTGPFNLLVDGRVYLPFGDGTQAKHQFISLRSTQSATYDIGKWTLGLATYIRYYGLTADAAAGKTNLFVYAGPNINYQFTPTVGGFVLYEMGSSHKTATPDLVAVTDLEPGISWDITKSFNFSPYLNMYPGGKFLSLDTISANMLATYKFF